MQHLQKKKESIKFVKDLRTKIYEEEETDQKR